MKFSCDNCGAQYMIADEKVGPRGVKVRCKKCSHIIVVRPRADEEAAASPPSGLEPGATDPGDSDFPMGAESTGEDPGLGADAPAPEAGGQIGGAFDSLFGGGDLGLGGDSSRLGAFGGDTAGGDEPHDEEGNGQLTDRPTEPAGTAPGEKEWYVAVDDSQVGPIDVAEIEQRWDARELTEDNLAWKAGMSDWAPIAEIPELAYLITERPQESTEPAASLGALAAGAPSGDAGRASLGPVAFGGDSVGGGDVSWKPSAASALSSLVQEELVAKEQSDEGDREAPAGMPEMGMPSFGATDLFGGGSNGAAGAPATSPGFNPPPTSGSFGGAGFSVPAPRPTSGGLKPIHLILSLVVVVVLVAGAVAAVFLLRPATPSPGVAQAPAAAPVAPAANAPPAKSPVPNAQTPPSDPPRRTSAPSRTPPRPKPKVTKAKRRPKPNKGLDEILNDKPAKRAGPVKAKLGVQDIFQGVKKNANKVMPCLQKARSRGEILSGKYTLKLDWKIRPDGSVTAARLTGPSNVLGTSLPQCFASAMKRWRFPASREGVPVRNFPFGPFTVK